MKKTGKRPRPSLLLLLLTCVLATSSCAGSGQRVKPTVCPSPQPASPNVMRSPNYEQRIRAILFESGETPTIRSEPASPP